MDLLKLTNEGFRILLFLAPGYVGLRLYLIDKPWSNLSPVHIFYGSLLFSVLSYGTCDLLGRLPKVGNFLVSGMWLPAILSIIFAAAYGLVWRRVGHPIVHKALKVLRITNEDNAHTPWTALFNNSNVHVSQLVVHLKNGISLQLDSADEYHLKEYVGVGIYPHYTSFEGDISFVANQVKEKIDGEWREIQNIYNPFPWGLKLFHIRASEISYVEARVIPCDSKARANSLVFPGQEPEPLAESAKSVLLESGRPESSQGESKGTVDLLDHSARTLL